MANRPSTAVSVISSAISEDVASSRPNSAIFPSSRPVSFQPTSALRGYSHVAGPVQYTGQVPTGSVGGGRSTAASSRPQSPPLSVGRTHVPSLTASGFFKPMSSQRLQAQRLGRPNTARTSYTARTAQSIPADDRTDAESRRSISTTRHASYAPMPEHERAPPSRGTEFTDPVIQDRTTNNSPLGDSTTRSLGDGLRLLDETSAQQQSQPRAKPQQLNLSTLSHETPQRSPLSFRSGLSFGSKRQPAGYGHQHLPSNGTSQNDGNVPLPGTLEQQYNQKRVPQTRNYEYFQGNTVFWLGGRLQNARDRPINIATGVFLILPAILFFVFS
jgi:palmitoyltransferase ZDHHC9/14/18